MRIARCIALLLLVCVSSMLAAQSSEQQEDTIPYIISYYIVKRPDVVTNIAYKLKVDPVTIVKLNRLRNVNQLLVEGQRIKIPEYYKGYIYEPPVKIPTAANKEEEMPAARAMAVEQTTTGRYVIANNQKDDERELDSFRYEQTGLLYQEIKYKQLEAQAKIDALYKTDIPDSDQSTQATLKRMERAKRIAQLEQPLIKERDSLAQIVAPLETQLKVLSEKLDKPVPVVQAPVIEPDPIIIAANTKPAKDDKKRDDKENKKADSKQNVTALVDTAIVASAPDSKVLESDVAPEPKGKRNKENKNSDKNIAAKDTIAAIAVRVDTTNLQVLATAKVEVPKPVEVKKEPAPKKAEQVTNTATNVTAKVDTVSKSAAINKKTLNEDNGSLKRPGKAPNDTIASVAVMPGPSAVDTAAVAKKDKPAKRVPRDASLTEQKVTLSTIDTFSTAVKPARKDTLTTKPVEAGKPNTTIPVDTVSTAELKNKKTDKRSNKQEAAKDTVVKVTPIVTAKDTTQAARAKPTKKDNKAEAAVKDSIANSSAVIITSAKDTVATTQVKGNKKDKRDNATVSVAKDIIGKRPEAVKPVAVNVTAVKDTVSTVQVKGKNDKNPVAQNTAAKDTIAKTTIPVKPVTTTAAVSAKDTLRNASVASTKTDKKPVANNTASKDTVVKAVPPVKPAIVAAVPSKDTAGTAQLQGNKTDKKAVAPSTAAKDTIAKTTVPIKPVTTTVAVSPKDTLRATPVATSKTEKKPVANNVVPKDTVTKTVNASKPSIVTALPSKDTLSTAQVKGNKPDKNPTAPVAKDTIAKPAPVIFTPVIDTVAAAQLKPGKADKKTVAANKDTVMVIRPLPSKDTAVVVQQTPRAPKPAVAIRDTSGQVKALAPVSITARADTAKAYNREVTVTIPAKLTIDSVQFIKAAFSLERAKRAIESRDFKEAETHIKKSLSLYPKYNDAFILSGDVFSAQGKLDKAIDAYTNSTKLDSNNAKVFYNLAQLYVNISKPSDALKAYSKAISLDNKYVMAYIGRAALYNDMQDYKASVADYDKVIELNRFYTYAYKARGNTKFLKEDYKGSIEDFNRYLEMEDQDAQVFYQRGLAKLKLNQLLQGCMDFDSAFRLGYKEAEKAIKKYCE